MRVELHIIRGEALPVTILLLSLIISFHFVNKVRAMYLSMKPWIVIICYSSYSPFDFFFLLFNFTLLHDVTKFIFFS